MRIEESFNVFMHILEKPFNEMIKIINANGEISYQSFDADHKNISITLAINAFCFQTLTNIILTNGGVNGKKQNCNIN